MILKSFFVNLSMCSSKRKVAQKKFYKTSWEEKLKKKVTLKRLKKSKKKVAKRNCLRIRSLPPFVLVQSFFVFSSFLTATVYVKDLSLSLSLPTLSSSISSSDTMNEWEGKGEREENFSNI